MDLSGEMDLEPVTEYPAVGGRDRSGRTGALIKTVGQLASYTRDHPEILHPDRSGRYQMFRYGPYSQDSEASHAARRVHGYGERFGGTVEAFGKSYFGRSYLVMRFIPDEALELRVVGND